MMFHQVSIEEPFKDIDSLSMKIPSFIIKINVVTPLFGMIITSFRAIRVLFRYILYKHPTNISLLSN